jgi:hypothetical protein
MFNIDVYRISQSPAEIKQLGIKRDWMDDTDDSHAYKCFPLSLSNSLGWGLYFPEDITFIWDGISSSNTSDHVKILKGEKYAYTSRENATISFRTGLLIRTDPDVTMLAMPAPNYILDGVQPFTTLISTSFFKGEFPVAWRITRPNVEITIKAGTPIASLLPISLSGLNNSEVNLKSMFDLEPGFFPGEDYGKIVHDINSSGRWTNFYRDAVDHKGKKIGDHEVKSLRLKVNDGKPEMCNDK